MLFALLGLFACISLAVGKPGFSDLEWGLQIGHIGLVIVATGIMLLLNVVVAMFSPGKRDRVVGGTWKCLIFVAFAATMEELFFRGVLLPKIGLIGSSLIFGVMHIRQGFVDFAYTSVMGLLLGICLVETGNLSVPIAVHVLHNVAVFMLSKGKEENATSVVPIGSGDSR